MITMAFDSTAKSASVAVLEDEHTLACFTVDNGLTQSELLLPLAEDMLKALKLSFDDVGLYAVAAGPGSFTGVRIGVCLIKGLSFGRGVPCVCLSTLEALAENARGLSGVVVPVMDARRNQVYGAIFSSDGKSLKRLASDGAYSITELAEMLKAYENQPIYLVGDGYSVAYKGLLECGVSLCNTPKALILGCAASIARLALEKYRCGEYTTDTEAAPTYLRLPQAERERLERENNNK